MEVNVQKFNQIEKGVSMKTEELFEFAPGQEPISFAPVGGDLERIGVDSRKKIILFPPSGGQESPKKITISVWVPEKGKSISREVVEQWCKENGWELATGFELASFYETAWNDYSKKEISEKELSAKLDFLGANAVATGDDYEGNYVATSKAQWDYSLTLFSP